MEIFKIKKSNQTKLDKVLNDDEISRLSITLKDGSVIGENDYIYLILEGYQEKLVYAKKVLDEISENLNDDEKKKMLSIINNENQNVLNGAGFIFG